KNIFETIVDFEDEGTEIVEGLAHDWDVSDDGLEYTFELEEDVTFHDGTDFNADAVVKNFERWAGGDEEMFPYYNTMFGGFEEEGDDDYERNPVGTVPFEFVEWLPNDSITVEKYDDYWQEGLPKLDEVVFRSIPDNASRLNALNAGEIDLADGINPSDGEAIENDPELQLIERPSMNIGYLGLTVTREPFDQKEVRQAMNYA